MLGRLEGFSCEGRLRHMGCSEPEGFERCYCGILMFKGCTRKLEQGFFTKVCSGRTRHNNFKQKEGRFRLHARKKKDSRGEKKPRMMV